MLRVVRKSPITLIEIMIVMFLIAMITGVLAYNYRGSLEEGRAFKTHEGIEKVKTILLLKVAEDSEAMGSLEIDWKSYVARSPLTNNAKDLIMDGWGNEYRVSVSANVDGEEEITVKSEKYESYKRTRHGVQ